MSPSVNGSKLRLTMAQALVKFLQVQHSERDGRVRRLIPGIFTRDINRAMRFAREAQSGNVHINWTPLWRADFMPYGGLKGSGIGKEGPRYAVEEMTDMKTIVIHGLGA